MRLEQEPAETRRLLAFLTDDGKDFVTRLLRCFDAGDSYDRETDYRMGRNESLVLPGRNAMGRLKRGTEPQAIEA